jgi:FtsZ-interacting cell division protein ZipA
MTLQCVHSVWKECLEFILECGARNKEGNKYVEMIKEVDGFDKIKNLRKHKDQKIWDKAVKVLEVHFNCKSKKKRKEEIKKAEKKKKKEKKKLESEIEKNKFNDKEPAIVHEPDMIPPETSTETQVDRPSQEDTEALLSQIEELRSKLRESERARVDMEQEVKQMQQQSIDREQKLMKRVEAEIIDLKKEHAMMLEMEKITNARLQRQLDDEEVGICS